MAPPQLTIRFRGLCLFALSTDGMRIHVFLAQPKDMGGWHKTIVRYREADGSWTASELLRWGWLDYGTGSSPATIATGSSMTNLCTMLGIPGLPEREARPAQSTPPQWQPHDYRGSHVTLQGGTLSVKDVIGVWTKKADPATEYRLPYIVEWTGEGMADAELEIWNTTPKEAPTLGKNSREQTQDPNDDPAVMAAMHLRAYFQILTGTDGPPMVMTRTIPPTPKPRIPGTTNPYIESLTVSSCPGGLAFLVP